MRHLPLEAGIEVLEATTPDGLRAALRIEVPADGGPIRLAVRSRPFAILRINDQPRGTTPLGGIQLFSGTHHLRLTAPGLDAPLELDLHVEAGDSNQR
jgi:hypothetical protein